jgi:hypothetical protein
VPPLLPRQVHVHATLLAVLTAEAVPALHRLAVGALLKVWPFAVPQAPFVPVTEPLDELVLEPDELLLEPEELLVPPLLLDELELELVVPLFIRGSPQLLWRGSESAVCGL